MALVFIYALCEPETQEIRYIGKTVNLERRFNQHLWTSIKERSHLGNWLRKLQRRGEVPSVQVLEKVDSEVAPAREIQRIRDARESGHSLVNSTDGGEGVTMTPETRGKISAANSGAGHPMFGKRARPETREKMSRARRGEKNPNFGRPLPAQVVESARAANRGRKHPPRSPEWCAKLSAALSGENHPNFGRRLSAETRRKMSLAAKGVQKSPQHRANMRAAWVKRKARI